MNGHSRHPFRVEDQAIMLADLRLRELHQLSAERRLAAHATAAGQPAASRRLRLPPWVALPWRTAMRAATPLAQ